MKKIFFGALMVGAITFGYSQSSYYNDYRSSISGINWQTMAAELLLTPYQKEQLFALNNRYDNYDDWNRVYGNNPDRWRTHRYGELERILGREKYTKFKNRYYKGQNPVAVYNRNKNNNKPYENKSYKSDNRNVKSKSAVKSRSTVAERYQNKKYGNSAAVKAKGNQGNNGKAVSHGKGKK